MDIIVAGQTIKGIAFDLEGTILDLERQHWQAHAAVAKAIGLTLDLNNSRTFLDIPHMIGGPDITIMDEILLLARKRGVLKKKNLPSVEEMLRLDMEEYHRQIDQLNPENFKPRPGFLNFFLYLKEYNFPATIGTLTKANEVFTLLGKSGLAEYFRHDDLTYWEDVQHTKPDPAVYLATAAKLHIWPTQQLVFEDSHNGIKAAKAAGSLPIAIPTVSKPDTIKRLEEAGAIKIYSSWEKVRLSPILSLSV